MDPTPICRQGQVRDGADGEGAGGRPGEEQDPGGRHGRHGDKVVDAVCPAKVERGLRGRRGHVEGFDVTSFTLFTIPLCLTLLTYFVTLR